MRPTQRVNGEEARRAVLAGVLERYRAVLRDPASVQPESAGPDPISQWAAAEYGDGPALAEIVELAGPLAAEVVAALALDAVAELTQLHAAGAVHGDLNPSNVLLSGSGVRLVHSGVAHTIDGATLTDLSGNPRTVAYLTPEQILGQPFGPPADVFALGGVLAFAAVGVPAFGNDEPNAVLYRIVHEEAALDAVPDALRGLVKACLSKDPAQRPTLQTLADRARGVFSDAVAAQLRGETGESDIAGIAAEDTRMFTEPVTAEETAAYEPVFDGEFTPGAVPEFDPGINPEFDPGFGAGYDAGFEPEFQPGFEPGFDPGPDPAFEVPAESRYESLFETGTPEAAPFEAQAPAESLFDPPPGPAYESAFAPQFESAFEPAATATFPAPLSDPELTLTEVPLRDPFESMPTRRHPRYEPLSDLTPDSSAQPTVTAAPLDEGGRPRRRSRSVSIAVLGAVVAVGVVAALVVRGMTHPNAPAAAPTPSVPVMPTAPLPGTFLTGPGCPATPWAAVTQAVAPAGGLTNIGGGAPDCGGAAIAFVKSGTVKTGGSSYSWTFHLGWSARCTLSVYIANAAPSSGLATYQLLIPVNAAATPAPVTFRINQGAAKGQWVAAPQLANVSLPGGSVQLTLTDTGAFPGDRFHVTASAVQAVCSQVP